MRILALTGGVGGAKLALGLASIRSADEVAFLVNTGDDFEHYGLHVSPDVDTLLYTLAGLNNQELGWGREGDSWNCLKTLDTLGGESWFQLGDRDLALHLVRTKLLKESMTLTEVIGHVATQLGIEHKIFPMSNEPISTRVNTVHGELEFQRYFVEQKCEPVVTGFRFDGIEKAQMVPDLTILSFDCVIICPSNPFVSVDPILAVPGMRDYLHSLHCPVVAVSPIIDGKAIKGPAAKMLSELNLPVTSYQIAKHYRGLVNGIIIDRLDSTNQADIKNLGLRVAVEQTIMRTLEDRKVLAQSAIDFAMSL